MRRAFITLKFYSDEESDIPSPPLNPLMRAFYIGLPMKDISSIPKHELARAGLVAERKASLSYNTCAIRVTGKMPCTREELLTGAAHAALGEALANILHDQFDQGLFPVFVEAVESLPGNRR